MRKKQELRAPLSSGESMKRRTFLKQAGGRAIAATAAVTVPAAVGGAQTIRSAATFDWICVGAGVAGCMAAIVGHDKGLKTVLLERDAKLAGTTSESAGTLWVPLNKFQQAAGIQDSREKALAYLEFMGGGDVYTRRQDMEWYVDNAARAIAYFHEKADVKFRVCEMPEFLYPEAPGSMPFGRSLICEPFPAADLGAWRNKVGISSYHHGLSEALENTEHNPSLGGRVKGGSDGPHIGYSGPVRGDEKKIALWRKRLGSKLDVMLTKDEEHRVAGASLLAHVFRAVLKRGIEVRTETTVEKLLVENGRVVGVTVRRAGKEENIRATRGVMLGTGGGNGMYLAAAAGAALDTEAEMPGPLPSLRDPSERGGRGNYEQRMRHSIIVNKRGERFGDETRYGGLPVNRFEPFKTHRFENIPNYFIFDTQLLEKYSFLGLPPGNTTEGLEWIAKGNTLAELAQKLQLPAENLEATVTRFNQVVTQGNDRDFDRGPETLGRVEKPPYYGLQVTMIDPLRVSITVVVNRSAQVLGHDGKKPIPGLYAVGPRSWIETDQIWGIGYQAGFDLTYIALSALSAGEHVATAGAASGKEPS
jgi:glycine/D-amino acid oxidase-like deaminating enzyme